MNLINTNGLSIKAFPRQGKIMVRVKCKSRQGNLEVAEIPAEYGMYWYPLAFYFDYYYYTNYRSILLHVDNRAPQAIQDEFGKRNHFLHNYYNYKEGYLGEDKSMYLMNLSITTKLKSMGLKTWDGFYNLQDVSYNYELLSNSLDKIEQTIAKRQEKDIKDGHVESPIKYANEEEKAYLSDLGMAYRMNNYMRKITGARMKFDKRSTSNY